LVSTASGIFSKVPSGAKLDPPDFMVLNWP
jgi:hypothetical protein